MLTYHGLDMLDNLGHASIAALLVLASTLYLQIALPPEQEIISEIFCWALILVCGVVYFSLLSNSIHPQAKSLSPSNLDVFALCAALLCLSKSLKVVNWSAVSTHLF